VSFVSQHLGWISKAALLVSQHLGWISRAALAMAYPSVRTIKPGLV
jgi:hypothetical protein